MQLNITQKKLMRNVYLARRNNTNHLSKESDEK